MYGGFDYSRLTELSAFRCKRLMNGRTPYFNDLLRGVSILTISSDAMQRAGQGGAFYQ